MKTNELVVNGEKYILKSSIKNEKGATKKNNMPYVIVRTYGAGVFAGYLESQKGQEVVMREARRIWYWAGAASLSQLATDGTSKPTECKFPAAVDTIKLLDAIEVINCTEKAKVSINSVENWSQ